MTFAFTLPAMPQCNHATKHFTSCPLFADGNGCQSSLLVSNSARSTSHCPFQLYGMDVDTFANVGSIKASDSTASFELPHSTDLELTIRSDEASASGYATLDSTESCAAPGVLAGTDGSGDATGMTTVFSSQPATVFLFPVPVSVATLGSAIANHRKVWDDPDSPPPPDTACHVVLEDTDLMRLGAAGFVVPANSNVVRFLKGEVPIPAGFTRVSATGTCGFPVALIELRFKRHPDSTIRSRLSWLNGLRDIGATLRDTRDQWSVRPRVQITSNGT